MNRIRFIVVKEVHHILRDPKSLTIAIAMPLLMTLLYGYAVNLDTRNIRLAVVDRDNTRASRELASSFFETGYFEPVAAAPDAADMEEVLRRGVAHAVLVVRPGFSSALASGTRYEVGLLVDGADANRAAAISNYSSATLASFLARHSRTGDAGVRLDISRQVLYNPDLSSPDFFVPGLIAMILMMISALLTSVTVVREKESGTLEQLLAAPVSGREVIAGKVIPYIGLAFLDGLLVILFGILHFGVPFVGAPLVLTLFGVVYIAAALSLGVLISTLVNTQLVAMLAALMATVLPAVMLSGFIFEIKNMPVALQVLTQVVPATHFIVIIRGVMLKGAGIAVLWQEGLALLAIALVLLAAATRRFKLKLG
jgi:ABC-2 type transport system permease protein